MTLTLTLHQSAPLEMCFCQESLFAEVKIFSVWPKTMDLALALAIVRGLN